MRLPNYSRCFVCGHGNPRGLNVRFDTDGHKVWAEFNPAEEQMGYHGLTHGGVLSALLDECMGWAACVRRGVFFLAAELTVRFQKPVALGQRLLVEGEIVTERNRLCECQGRILDEAGAVLVRAQGKFIPVSADETQRIIDYLADESEVPWPRELYELRDRLARGM